MFVIPDLTRNPVFFGFLLEFIPYLWSELLRRPALEYGVGMIGHAVTDDAVCRIQ
jgi:hypothetical protein